MTWRLRGRRPDAGSRPCRGLGIGPGEHLEVDDPRRRPRPRWSSARPGTSSSCCATRAGDGAVAFVERIDPHTLEPLAQSPELAGGPVWPGGLGAHDNGSLHVVFGNHAHRLDADLAVLASRQLPRERPYNSFVRSPTAISSPRTSAALGPASRSPPATASPASSLVLEPDSARDRRPSASSPSRRSPASRPTATTCTSSATRA